MPLTISASDIQAYLMLNDLPVDIDVFMEVIYMLDNEFIDESQERLKQTRKKPSK